ncbi:hypothetical protein FRACYDRAFT_269487 [Fragilariopsis cylindrus CCMP1102]|uniref:Uncharacterized protein n=1 Tax=Fragilariopsis cylindrus CCMP1102 TaxID=635003 RepID=A0A1E7FCB7_9STRA|nr:hypothetical protein FRACYDRAFT_269487 [Fragilariopsis cylindrus CCMP1102]|eukprot:OEU15789.1 hypothetical protein FRACYDRAFT_269487 [Fragilariopsis cylindrus CCMP1102]
MKSFFASVELYLFRIHLSFLLTNIILSSHLISSHVISSHLISSSKYTNSGKEHDTKGHGVPETKGTSEGSAARNIQRKSDHVKGKEKKQGGGGLGHKGDWKTSTDGM